jgi:hypothetical protein
MIAAALHARDLTISRMDGGYRRRLLVLTGLVFVLSLGLARLVLAVDIFAVAGLAVLAVLLAVSIRPRLGLYLLFGIVLFFDGIAQDPLMLPGRYISSSLQSTLHLTGGVLIPFEILLLLTSTVWLAQATMRRQIDFRGGFFGRVVLIFGLVLMFGVVRGLASGANFNYSFWESRFLFGLLLAYVVAANTIRTRAHVRTLLNLVFICVGLSVIEAVWRKYALINNGLVSDMQEGWYSHEDVVIWGLMLVIVLAQQVFGGPRWQRILGPFLALAAVLAMLISERRAGLIAVGVAVVICTIALARINRKAFLLIAVPGLLAGLIYLPLFWNSPGTLGQGARAVRSISSPDARDAASNLWRDIEAVNVRATIASDPLLGIGFGRPFLQVVAVPDISFFEFWNYEAHHNILWVWMKIGAFGFISFFALILGGIARSIWLARTLAQPEYRAFALVTVGAIVMSVVFCYVDLGLTSPRIPTLLGVCLGTVGVLHRLRD